MKTGETLSLYGIGFGPTAPALLSGGRWPARKRATSDPTAKKRGNACGAKGPCCIGSFHQEGRQGCCVKKTRKRHAVREDEGRPLGVAL
jgi:hypothetical protein